MDWDRRRALGRWAEVAGPAGVEQDAMMRRFRLGPSAQADFEVVSPETRAMLTSYAAGVNAFIRTAGSLPIEYRIIGARPEPWEPWHSMAVFKVRHILMGVYEGKMWNARLVRRLGPEAAAQGHAATPPRTSFWSRRPAARTRAPSGKSLPDFGDAGEWPMPSAWEEGGSNNWALHGSRTASGLAAIGRRPASRAGSAQRLLPEPHSLRRVRRCRAIVPRSARFPPLRPQRKRRLVRDPRHGRLPGPVH